MLKKIVLGTLFVGLVAVLVIGAANRTSARASEADDAATASESSSGQGSRGQGSGVRGQGSGSDVAQAEEVVAWVTVDGAVTGVTDNEIVIDTADGQQVAVGGRPWSYAQEQQFTVQVGDRLRLQGFYEGEELEVGRIENQRSGATVQMRDTSGRPMWSGRGRWASGGAD
jgi:hypothetical protein